MISQILKIKPSPWAWRACLFRRPYHANLKYYYPIPLSKQRAKEFSCSIQFFCLFYFNKTILSRTLQFYKSPIDTSLFRLQTLMNKAFSDSASKSSKIVPITQIEKNFRDAKQIKRNFITNMSLLAVQLGVDTCEVRFGMIQPKALQFQI